MKKFLSVFLVAAMLIAALAMVACGEKPGDETTTTTTEATAEATTTTTEETTVTTTTEATTTTTETTTTETTTTEETTTTISTEPVFARFDFGTKSYASEHNLTSHEYLTSKLTYNDKYVSVKYDEDNIIVTALQSYNYGSMRSSDFKSVNSIVYAYALCFEDISADYEFDDPQEIHAGQAKNGYHQYMKIRIKNMTLNNMISFQFKCNGGFSTTANVSNMYLQGGMGKGAAEDTVAKEISNEWRVYYYDIPMCCQACSYAYGAGRNGIKCSSYSEWLEKNAQTGGNNGLNWTQNATGLRFNLLGAVYYFTSASVQAAKPWCDSRANIKRGNCVEIDYIVFGSTVEQLEAFKSKMEIAGTK